MRKCNFSVLLTLVAQIKSAVPNVTLQQQQQYLVSLNAIMCNICVQLTLLHYIMYSFI